MRKCRSICVLQLLLPVLLVSNGLTSSYNSGPELKLPGASGLTVIQPSGKTELDIQWTNPHHLRRFRVLLDDASPLRHLILSREVEENHFAVDCLEAGLVPGVTYYVRIDPEGVLGPGRVNSGAAAWKP